MSVSSFDHFSCSRCAKCSLVRLSLLVVFVGSCARRHEVVVLGFVMLEAIFLPFPRNLSF